MTRYQIRVGEHQVLEDIIEMMATKTWGILIAWQVFLKEPQSNDFEKFHKSIYLHMLPSIKSYKLCGYTNICLDEARWTQWAPPAQDWNVSPRDLIYHLFPGKGLEKFLDDLTGAAIESLVELVKSESKEEVQSLIKTAFRTILGEHLLFNSFCGKTELCAYSTSSSAEYLGNFPPHAPGV